MAKRPHTSKPPLVSLKVETQFGRLKMAISKKNDENKQVGASGKSGKKMVVMACRKCGNPGHNARGCKGQGATIEPSVSMVSGNSSGGASGRGNRGAVARNGNGTGIYSLEFD
ncbi:hypothetical protein LguiB_007954 [Lonicera macranthoides]